jgi:hypothetical protein
MEPMEALVDSPIATYRENTAWRQQAVELFPDRVDVHRSKNYPDGKRFVEFTNELLARIRDAHYQSAIAAYDSPPNPAQSTAPN